MRLLRNLALVGLFGLTVPTVAMTGPGPGEEGAGPASEDPAGRRGPRARGDRDGGARLMAMLERRDPARHAKLTELAEGRPYLVKTLIAPAARTLRPRDLAAWSRFTAVLDASYELHQQLDAYEAAKPKRREAMKSDIEETVAKLFDLRQGARRTQLAQLEARLAKLRADIDSREANKDTLVDTFTEEMLRKVGEPGF